MSLLRIHIFPIVFGLVIVGAYPGESRASIEDECRSTFNFVIRWNGGNPRDIWWDQRCWEYVKKVNGQWKWVGEKKSHQEQQGFSNSALNKNNSADPYPTASSNTPSVSEYVLGKLSQVGPFSMDRVLILAIAGLGLLFSVSILRSRKVRKVREDTERFMFLRDQILAAHKELSKDDYLSNQRFQNWRVKFVELSDLTWVSEGIVHEAGLTEEVSLIRQFFRGGESLREHRNTAYLRSEKDKYSDLFDSMERYPLTERQREAIIRNDNHCLTVAGAGTGKTSTVIGRVAYLLNKNWCEPSEILLISYSKDTVLEMERRLEKLGIEGVAVKTFHKLGLDIIKKHTETPPGVMERPPVRRYLSELVADDRGLGLVIDYVGYFYYPEKHDNDFASLKEANEFATYHNLETLRGDKVTIRGELVKSIQEVKIANWLFLNGIDYQYEKRYPFGQDVYQPDFFLPEYEIYLEHFGINRDNSTRPDIDPQKYQRQMEWKRAQHQANKTTLVETYSYQFKEGAIFDDLERQLTQLGVERRPLEPDEVRALRSLDDKLAGLSKLLTTFLSLYKSDPGNSEDQLQSFRKINHSREQRFLVVFDEILKRYEKDLSSMGKIDFEDMISRAAEIVDSSQYQSPYKAIIVDEYQDISRARAKLLNAFHSNQPDTRLLCVGDDWQSIYRFSGSDVRLMTTFEESFPRAVRIDLDRSFRFNDKLLEASSKFVTKNPDQLKKAIVTEKKLRGPAITITSRPVEGIVSSILAKREEDASEDKSLFVLGRFNFSSGVSAKWPKRVTGKTVHKSKGLEANDVVISDVVSDKYGFPSGIEDDPIVALLLPGLDGFPHAEERRLFYVALTRAKDRVFVSVPLGKSPSVFVEELVKEDQYRGLVVGKNLGFFPEVLCPVCGSTMIRRENSGTEGVFLSCAHYPRCRGSRPGCPSCGEGILVRKDTEAPCTNLKCDNKGDLCPRCATGISVLRQGRNGSFIGCSAYPYAGCRFSSSVNEGDRGI